MQPRRALEAPPKPLGTGRGRPRRSRVRGKRRRPAPSASIWQTSARAPLTSGGGFFRGGRAHERGAEEPAWTPRVERVRRYRGGNAAPEPQLQRLRDTGAGREAGLWRRLGRAWLVRAWSMGACLGAGPRRLGVGLRAEIL